MSEAPQVIEVAAALLHENGRYLITLRPAGTHCGALWEFPGGKRQQGETLKHCLQREIREELGLEIAVGELIACIGHSYADRDVRIHFFDCRRLSGEPQALGCSEYRWVAVEQLRKYAFPPADARLLEKLVSGIES